LDISDESLTTALPALSRQTGVVVLYPYELAQVRSNPVKGLYTVPEALQVMLQGTGFSGDVTAQGAVAISRQKRHCDREGEAMLRDSKSTVSVIALLASLFSYPVCAQTASAAAGGGQDASAAQANVESVVVTGSRVITDAANSPTPVTAITQDQLLVTTPTTIADALTKLPQLAFSSTSRNAGGASNNGAGNFLNLRNFGQQRTLVLQDGMRVPPSNSAGSVDVSTLPQMLVSRVDVVTGGASAVYGSDAITGVVNFILDKNFDGLKYRASAGLSTYADGFSQRYGVAAGTGLFGGRGHIEAELGWNHQDEVQQQARPRGAQYWSQYGTGKINDPYTNFPQGRLTQETIYGNIICSNCSVNGQEFVSNNVIGPTYGGIPVPSKTSVEQGGDGGWWSVGTASAALTQSHAFGRFSYDLNDDTVFFAEANAAEARVFSHFIPSQEDFQRQNIFYYKNNPFLSAEDRAKLGDDSATDPNWATDGTNTFQMPEWIDPLFPGQQGDYTRRTNSTTRNLTFTTGLSGEVFGAYDWNFHYTHGESRLSEKGINNGNNQYHDAQQDAVQLPNGQIVCYNDTPEAIALYGDLYPGCVPIDAFGPNGISNAAFNYWSRTTKFAMTNKVDDVSADIAGDIFTLPAGPIRAALSAEMRWQNYIVKSDADPTQLVDCTGLRLCGNSAGTGPVDQSKVTQAYWDNNALASVQADENVWEFAGEVNVPLLKDLPLIESLSTDVAGRYTDYSVSGAVQTWKVGLDWRINDDFRVRGTTSVDIRAPTLNDLYQPETLTSIGFNDILTGFGNGLEQRSGGNPALVPEVSRTYTAGIVYTPSYIPGLTASVDFYNINMKNLITSISGSNTQIQTVCNASGGTSPYCALYIRPHPWSDTSPDNYPLEVLSESLNAAFQATEGEDYEVDYGFDTADVDSSLSGLVNFRLFLNVQPKIDSINFQGAQVQHTTSQKGHASFMAGYTLNNWSVNYQLTWFSGFNKNGFLATPTYYAEPRVPSFNTSDITVTKKLDFGDGSTAQMYVSVQNVFNAQTPVVNGSSSNPGVGLAAPAGEDTMGRYFTIGIRGNL